jgi:signal peptidase I
MHPVNPSTSADSPYAGPADGPHTRLSTGEPPLPPTAPPKTRAKPTWAVALEWGLLLFAALAIAVLIKTFLFQAFYIPSDSMVPTLKTNDRVIVNKLSYHLHPVHRGDIIVFKTPLDEQGRPIDPGVHDLVKRVIALPGETVEGRADGRIYINGKVLKESYLPKGQSPGADFAPVKVPAQSYWVMGDNRSNSRDSRFFPKSYPFVRKKDIIGRVILRLWPLNRLGIL